MIFKEFYLHSLWKKAEIYLLLYRHCSVQIWQSVIKASKNMFSNASATFCQCRGRYFSPLFTWNVSSTLWRSFCNLFSFYNFTLRAVEQLYSNSRIMWKHFESKCLPSTPWFKVNQLTSEDENAVDDDRVL